MTLKNETYFDHCGYCGKRLKIVRGELLEKCPYCNEPRAPSALELIDAAHEEEDYGDEEEIVPSRAVSRKNDEWDVESGKEPVECTGIFLRCRVNEYVSSTRNSIHQNVSFRVLKRISCNNSSCGRCTQFYEDLNNTNMENFFWPEDPVDGLVYVARFNLGKLGFEDLYEEWEWIIECAPKEKQV